MESSAAILLLTCPDDERIVASISNFIFKHNGNILCSARHTAEPGNIRFHRGDAFSEIKNNTTFGR